MVKNSDEGSLDKLSVINTTGYAQTDEDPLIAARADVLRSIVESSNDGIVGKDLNGVITTWNAGAERLFGYTAEEAIGKPITIIIPLDRQSEEADILARLRRGELIDHFETVRRRKDGTLIDISLTVSPIRDAEGRIIGASKIARDITERKRQADHLVFLMREMSHRTNNLLAVVHAMAQQTGRSSKSYEDFMARFIARIHGLASSNRLLVMQDWTGVPLDELVRLQLQPFVDKSVNHLEIAGPPVTLAVEAVQSLGIALHELATNASKYGAFSKPGGKVQVLWELFKDDNESRFRLVWCESGGPRVSTPADKGFGSVVLEQMTRVTLGCETETDFAVEGLRWTLVCPASRILSARV